jgi:hypothetical protein
LEKGLLSSGFGRILFSDKPMWISKIIGIGMAPGCNGRCIFWRFFHRFYAGRSVDFGHVQMICGFA